MLGSAAQGGDSFLGALIGGYRLVEEIGRGAMGVVYRAEHRLIGANAAVKVLRPQYAAIAQTAQRFVEEARAEARLRHPNTVQIFDLTTLPSGLPCIVMEYLEGETLEQLARRGPVPLERAVPILVQVCGALGAAHAAGIVHRDVKAENILLVNTEDQHDFVKVLDFGIAKVTAEDRSLTSPGMAIGTPAYMAPEQALGREVDARADLYAVGVLTFRLLVGALPFAGDGPAAVMLKQVQEPPPIPPGLPADVQAVLRKALAKDPADRYPAADELSRALGALVRRAPSAEPAFQAEVSEDGTEVRLRFASESAFRQVEEAELSKGRLLVPLEHRVREGSVALFLSVPGRGSWSVAAEFAVRVDRDQAAAWSMQPGFVLALHRNPGARAGAAPSPTAGARARAQGPAAQGLEALRARCELDHYGFLGLERDASGQQIEAACGRLEAELRRFGCPDELGGCAQFAALDAHLAQVRRILGEPEMRVRYDARLGNYQGVARTLADGLPLQTLDQLHRDWSAQHSDRADRAEQHGQACDAWLQRGDRPAALAALERALALDPLSRELQRRYWQLTRPRPGLDRQICTPSTKPG